MLPNKFKRVGMLLGILSIAVILGRVAYLQFRTPVTTTTIQNIQGVIAPAKSGGSKDTVLYAGQTKVTIQKTDSTKKVTISASTTTTESGSLDPVVFICNLLLLLSVLLTIISKEKIEDERIDKIRLIAFRISFVIGILIGLALMLLDYFKLEMTTGLLVACMLLGYILVFQKLKKREGDAAC